MWGHTAYIMSAPVQPVGRVPSRDVPVSPPDDPSPRRLRRLHHVWPDSSGNISYLLTLCVDQRASVLNNEAIFDRLVTVLLASPKAYRWFGRRFVVMPDHIHLIAHMGHDAIRLGQWIKALKSVVGGLERRVGTHGLQSADPADPASSSEDHLFTRFQRPWQWQYGFHDHKFRTPESESRKWEYVCLNPVRAGLVKRPEEWPFGGEIFYDDAGGPRLVRGTPPLLKTGMLVEEKGETTPCGDTRPTS